MRQQQAALFQLKRSLPFRFQRSKAMAKTEDKNIRKPFPKMNQDQKH